MNKKIAIISILSVFGVTLAIFLGLYFKNGQTPSGQTPISGVRPIDNLFGGGSTATSTGGSPDGQIDQLDNQPRQLAQLAQLYAAPVSGLGFFKNNDAEITLRFTDRQNGHTYGFTPIAQTGQAERVTNVTIPRVQEALWSTTGNNVIYRYLNPDTEEIASFSAQIKTSTSTTAGTISEISGSFLAPQIRSLAFNPSGTNIFTLLYKDQLAGAQGFIYTAANGDRKLVFDSPIAYWNVAWPNERIITLTTKPTALDAGFLYFLNPQTGAQERILGGLPALSTLVNASGTLVAYSHNTNGRMTLNVYDVSTRSNKNVALETLADKCVWSTANPVMLYCAVPVFISGNIPDEWYSGEISFSDNIWAVNTATGQANQIYRIGSAGESPIDVTDMHISSDERYLAFVNKNDLTLWILRIQ